MNTRIQNIAAEAGFTKDKYGLYWDDDSNSEGVDLERFAGLMVQECVRYINEAYQRDWSALWREDLSNGIKAHFGDEMNNEKIAVRQHLSKPRPFEHPCGCLGPQGNDPVCPCAMAWVEKVNGQWYQIVENRTPNGVDIVAKPLI